MARSASFGLATALSLILMTGPSLADLKDDLVEELTADGFESIVISRTWLGRTRIFAEGPEATREIIFHPRTGEILRDYSEPRDTGAGRPPLTGDPDTPRGRPAGAEGPVPPQGPAGAPPRDDTSPPDGERPDPPRDRSRPGGGQGGNGPGGG